MKHTSMAIWLALTLCGIALHAQTASPVDQPAQAESSDHSAIATTAPESEAPGSETPASSSMGTSIQAPISQVRIVRLSEVRGEVQLDRGTDRGFEAAFANLPIVQGTKLRTAQGVAEVEFEDNSTLRLTPQTEVEFPRLGRNASGTTASNVKVVKGTVYASLTSTQGNEFSVSFGNAKALLPPSSHIQLSVGEPVTRLGVYEGNVQVESASGTTVVGKKKALLFDKTSNDPPQLVSGLEKTTFDSWDHDAVQYHKKVANAVAYGGSTPAYGLTDLNYYGNFAAAEPGCGGGLMWRPYFASAAWDPFANGAYAYYPGAGYSFVSPYPWGWTPFHSGAWQYCPSQGWGWRPGGSWNGLTNTALLNVPHAPARPKLPLRPVPGRGTIVLVSNAPLPVSKMAGTTFVFHKDSAGLGVPRQAFGNLNKTSREVAQHGSVSTSVNTQMSAVPSQQAGRAAAANGAMSGQSNGRSPGMSNAGASRPAMGNSGSMGHGSSGGVSGGGAGSVPAGNAGGSPAGGSGGHH